MFEIVCFQHSGKTFTAGASLVMGRSWINPDFASQRNYLDLYMTFGFTLLVILVLVLVLVLVLATTPCPKKTTVFWQ